MGNETCVGQTAESAQNINYEKLRSAVKAIGFGYAFLYLTLKVLCMHWISQGIVKKSIILIFLSLQFTLLTENAILNACLQPST